MSSSPVTQAVGFGDPFIRLVLCGVVATALAGCDSGPSAEEHFQRGVEYQNARNLPAAAIELKNALEKDNEHGGARLHLGQIYLLIGNGAAAEKEFENARRIGVDAVETEHGLLRALDLQSRHEDILQRLIDSAVDGSSVLSPSETALYRGFAHAGLGEFDGGRQELPEAAADGWDGLSWRRSPVEDE